MFYPNKTKNVVTISVTTFYKDLKVVPPVLLLLKVSSTGKDTVLLAAWSYIREFDEFLLTGKGAR